MYIYRTNQGAGHGYKKQQKPRAPNLFKRIFNHRFRMQKLIPIFLFFSSQYAQFTLILDPAGDAEHAGRIIHDSYERGATLQLCTALKKNIEESIKGVRVILTRIPGEPMAEFLQNANLSNKLDVDLFVSVHMYKEKNITPRLWLYHMQNEPYFKKQSRQDVVLYPYDKVWRINIEKTKQLMNIFQDDLRATSSYDIHQPIGMPCKPLLGVQSPAFVLEIGVPASLTKELIDPIAHALKEVINHA